MQLLFLLPFGIYSDFIRVRKPFIILGLLICVICCFTYALTNTLGWVLAARALAGLAAATWVAFTVLFSSYYEDENVYRAMSMISFSVVLAQLVGMIVSGYIVKEWGWHAPFWIGGTIGIIGLLLSLGIYEPKQGVNREPIQLNDLKAVMQEPLLLKVSFLSIVAHSMIFTTMFGFVPSYALSIGMTSGELPLLVFFFMVPHAAATLLMGKAIVPRWGAWRSLGFAFLLSAGFTVGDSVRRDARVAVCHPDFQWIRTRTSSKPR